MRLLDLLLPPRCLKCGTQVEQQGALCPGCWKDLTFLSAPLCARCGYPFEFEPFEFEPVEFEKAHDSLCAQCIRRPPAFGRARAVFRYDDASRGLVLSFKHRDRTDAASAFGAWLARAGAPLLADADLIMPVPLHWLRLFRRRYNQAALLAGALSRASGRPAVYDALIRSRPTPSQGGLGREARRRNVRGAFRVRPGRAAALAGRRILLVDDVLTTGATAEECARALYGAGAAAVDLLTLARVVRAVA
jgi:ComF family protein